MATTIPTGTVTRTLAQIVRQVQDLLGDVIALTATEGGGTTTLIDAVNLFDSNASYVGSHLYAVSGTAANLTHLARVDGSDQSIGSLSFGPAFPSATAAADTFDMHNLHGAGWRRAEVVRRVQQHVAIAAQRALIERDDDGGTFDFNSPVIAIPDDATHNYAVLYQDRAYETVWHEVPPLHRVCRKARFEIEITGMPRRNADGQAIRLLGYGQHPVPTADDDAIAIDPMWLTLAVAAELAAQKPEDKTLQQWAASWTDRANVAWQDMGGARHNNVVRFR